MPQALSFFWGILLGALMLAAILTRQNMTWEGSFKTTQLAYAGVAVLLLVAALRFIVGGV